MKKLKIILKDFIEGYKFFDNRIENENTDKKEKENLKEKYSYLEIDTKTRNLLKKKSSFTESNNEKDGKVNVIIGEKSFDLDSNYCESPSKFSPSISTPLNINSPLRINSPIRMNSPLRSNSSIRIKSPMRNNSFLGIHNTLIKVTSPTKGIRNPLRTNNINSLKSNQTLIPDQDNQSRCKSDTIVDLRTIIKKRESVFANKSSFNTNKIRKIEEKIILNFDNSSDEFNTITNTLILDSPEENKNNNNDFEKYMMNGNFTKEEILNARLPKTRSSRLSVDCLSPPIKKLLLDQKHEHKKTIQNKTQILPQEFYNIDYKDCSVCSIF